MFKQNNLLEAMSKRPTGRHCAICKKTGGSAYTLPLKWLGVVGNYAHEACLRRAQKEVKA